MADLLLLCRHVSRDQERALAAAARGAEGLSSTEPAELVAVAEVLAESLRRAGVRVAAVRYAPSPIARRHAQWLAHRLAWSGDNVPFSMQEDLDLSPQHFVGWADRAAGDGADEDSTGALVRRLVRILDDEPPAPWDTHRAVLVVGHMPQLAWLGARLTGNRSLRDALADGYLTPLSLAHAEVAAIELGGAHGGAPRGRLLWTVASDDSEAIDDLRAKIKGKMETAKLLGGLITLVLGGVVLDPGRIDGLSRGGDRWAVYVAAVSFLVAIGLYLRTMYAYDALLMPRRYWSEDESERGRPRWLMARPPSSAAWILYQNMLRVWTYLFTPATAAVIVGLLALAYAALEPGLLEGAVALVVLAGVAIYAAGRGPVLGTQD